MIFGTIILYSCSKGRAQAVGLAASVASTVAVLDVGLLLLAGPDYSTGLVATTVIRSINAGAPTSPTSVLLHAFALTGALVVAAVAGVIVSVAKKMPGSATLFLCLLVLAALIAPINQARIHELSSLDKNMGFGLPFAAVGAGDALSGGRKWLARRSSWGYLAATVTAVALVFTVALSGRMQTVQFRGPARTTAYEAVADRVVTAIGQSYHPDTYVLVDRVAITELYYLPNIPPESWIVSAVHGKPQQEELTGLICSGDISVVVLREEGGKFDQSDDTNIVQLLRGLRRYKLKVTVPHGNERTKIWKLDSPGRPLEGCK